MTSCSAMSNLGAPQLGVFLPSIHKLEVKFNFIDELEAGEELSQCADDLELPKTSLITPKYKK